ncbi:hypothetical protein [Pararcticibacter amylolyticus]|uniref:Type II secretion system protein GspC N-terminal domain-containing protein n=1 Tax=Pararcticibacter amylolyticus TaxID=2173175 RepID=A0A2U2P9H8_9SPHI|nr:hypothetical protein [Pararcticibacter amylolyticus]PWG78042.1 hypothetical protein DDR33_24345 [Pararcticibacter amylolyticus]
MKNKKMTYVLIVSVAAVWGIIFYRIYTAAAGDEEYVQPAAYSKTTYQSLDEYQLKDTAKLSLNYRDPFSGQAAVPEPVVAENQNAKPFIASAPPPPPPVNWSIIHYTGYIVNSGLKRMVAIMNINGKEYMLSEGQKAEGVTLLKNYRDSVKVSYQNKTKYIRVE